MKKDWELQQYTNLTWAVRGDKVDRVRDLLGKKLDPHFQLPSGEMLFVEAVQEKRFEVVKVFLEFGAQPNKLRSSNGRTPLEIASLNGDVRMAELLLENGAYPNIPIGDDGFSLLHHVVSANNAALTIAMLKHGADEDALGPSGQTVMSYAAPKAKAAIHEFHAMKANRRLHGMHQRLRRARPNALI